MAISRENASLVQPTASPEETATYRVFCTALCARQLTELSEPHLVPSDAEWPPASAKDCEDLPNPVPDIVTLEEPVAWVFANLKLLKVLWCMEIDSVRDTSLAPPVIENRAVASTLLTPRHMTEESEIQLVDSQAVADTRKPPEAPECPRLPPSKVKLRDPLPAKLLLIFELS